MSIHLPAKSDVRFKPGMAGVVHIPRPNGYDPNQLWVVGVVDTSTCFELIEIRVADELAWWPAYDEMSKPLGERRGVILDRVVCHSKVIWSSDVALTIRCLEGPAVLDAHIVASFGYPTNAELYQITRGTTYPTARVDGHSAREWNGRRGRKRS